MNELHVYIAALFTAAAVSGFFAFAIFNFQPEMLLRFEKLPRSVKLGTLLGFIDLFWCTFHADVIVWQWMKIYLIPLAVVLTVLSAIYLDYLFSRALGGFFILCACYFLHESFTYHSFAAPFFAALCYVYGVVGLFFSGKPHLMRDFLRKCAKSKAWRLGWSAFCMIFAAFSLILAVVHLAR